MLKKTFKVKDVVGIYECVCEGYRFEVEVIQDYNEGTYDAWLCARNYGVKEYMFGVPIDHFNKVSRETEHTSLEEFVEMVENQLDDYIEDYIMEYVDGREI